MWVRSGTRHTPISLAFGLHAAAAALAVVPCLGLELHEFLAERVVSRFELHGVAAFIVAPDGTMLTSHAGEAQKARAWDADVTRVVEGSVPVTAETRFMAARCTHLPAHCPRTACTPAPSHL